jgi:transcriptional regulator with PAS, ATPase and Fis domain
VQGVVASFRDLSRELELAERLGEIEQFAGIIGRDQRMREIYRIIRELADSNVPVLITGESGTGKELVAAALHSEGSRADKLFVPVNCGALPENLLESELFGHVRGAFTGAIRDKKGRFELADGGTIFLDEIGDISAAMQVKLLRVLQNGTFQRVGGEETVRVDVRVISATNKDLTREIAAGRFREDLYYRLCVVPVSLPPLRQRLTDIPILVRHFMARIAREENRPELLLAPETLEIFLTYPWPGNIRELQNVIRYLMVRCREEVARPRHLPENLMAAAGMTRPRPGLATGRRRKLSVAEVRRALAETGGNRLQAAKRLGVGRATLYRFLDRHAELRD